MKEHERFISEAEGAGFSTRPTLGLEFDNGSFVKSFIAQNGELNNSYGFDTNYSEATKILDSDGVKSKAVGYKGCSSKGSIINESAHRCEEILPDFVLGAVSPNVGVLNKYHEVVKDIAPMSYYCRSHEREVKHSNQHFSGGMSPSKYAKYLIENQPKLYKKHIGKIVKNVENNARRYTGKDNKNPEYLDLLDVVVSNNRLSVKHFDISNKVKMQIMANPKDVRRIYESHEKLLMVRRKAQGKSNLVSDNVSGNRRDYSHNSGIDR